MSIERPSQSEIQTFLRVQENKKQAGNWHAATPIFLTVGFASSIFAYTLYNSMNPSGIVPRILYERTLSLPKRHLRHFFPVFVGLGSLFLWDYANGVWSPQK